MLFKLYIFPVNFAFLGQNFPYKRSLISSKFRKA